MEKKGLPPMMHDYNEFLEQQFEGWIATMIEMNEAIKELEESVDGFFIDCSEMIH